MATLAGDRGAVGRRGIDGRLALAVLALILLGLSALAVVAYALWPRWPEPPVAADAPALPIVVAGVRFNVPPRAVRNAVQRRPGTQERIDLVYLWPSLAPPDPAAPVPLGERDRVFVTIAPADALPPAERLKTIYPRYLAAGTAPGPSGLALFAFRDGTPFQGEDLAFDPDAPDKFLARCLRTINPLAPGTCLAVRRVGNADLTLRFPRDWLDDWHAVAGAIERLIGALRPADAS